jgi:hypothetical protein
LGSERKISAKRKNEVGGDQGTNHEHRADSLMDILAGALSMHWWIQARSSQQPVGVGQSTHRNDGISSVFRTGVKERSRSFGWGTSHAVP